MARVFHKSMQRYVKKGDSKAATLRKLKQDLKDGTVSSLRRFKQP